MKEESNYVTTNTTNKNSDVKNYNLVVLVWVHLHIKSDHKMEQLNQDLVGGRRIGANVSGVWERKTFW